MSLEEQKEQVIQLISNPQTLEELSAAAISPESLVSYFATKDISASPQEANTILQEKAKYKEQIYKLPEEELANIAAAGKTIIINNNNTAASSSSSSGGGSSSRHESKGEPMTALGGVAFGSVLTVVGIVLIALSAYKCKTKGLDSKL